MSVEPSSDAAEDGPPATAPGSRPSPPRSRQFEDDVGTSLYVRPYDETDFERLVAFYDGYPNRHRSLALPPITRSQIESWIEKLADQGQNLLAFDGERLIGHAAYSPRDATEGELIVFVDEKYHNRGIGTELCKQAIAHAAADGHESMRLSVDVDNEGAVHVYESLGFRTVERDGQVFVMRLDIDDEVRATVCE